jgi:DNA-binding NtrC family response regulator
MNNKGTVLVLDDEDHVRKVAEILITKMGFNVLTACNGDDAIEIFKKASDEGNPISIVLLDLTIAGGLGGKDIISTLNCINPNLKSIASSGYLDDPAMASPKSFGFTTKIRKPYLNSELQSLLKDLEEPALQL